jgi:hypothetical protein
MVALDPLDEHEGAGADWVLPKALFAHLLIVLRWDHGPIVGHDPEKGRIGLGCGDLDRIVVYLFYRIGVGEVVAVLIVSIGCTLPGKDDRVGVERLPVVEYDVIPQIEGVLGAIVRHLVALGQGRLQLALLVDPQQRVPHLLRDIGGIALSGLGPVDGVGKSSQGHGQRALGHFRLGDGRHLNNLFLDDRLFHFHSLDDFDLLLNLDGLNHSDDLWLRSCPAGCEHEAQNHQQGNQGQAFLMHSCPPRQAVHLCTYLQTVYAAMLQQTGSIGNLLSALRCPRGRQSGVHSA